MSTPTLYADTLLVAQAWLNGLFPTSRVAMMLPEPSDNGSLSWQDTGFVVVSTVGGIPNPYVPLRNPIVSVDCWAAVVGSTKPPWNMASNLVETILAGCQDHTSIPRALTLPTGYPAARVLSAYPVSEPQRVNGDPSSYARYNFSLALHWREEA